MKKFYLCILTILLAMAASAQTTNQKSLYDIIKSGKASTVYKITDELVGVYVPPRHKNVVFAKDNNNSYEKSNPSASQTTNGKIYDLVSNFDQSNWIKIYFPEGCDASAYAGKKITNVEGRINVASTPAGPVGLFIDVDGYTYPTTGDDVSYEGNLYNCANFVQQDWFFVLPKNLEYANIHWAVYQGNNMFYVPDNSQWPGSFKVKMDLWENQTSDNSVTADGVFQEGHAYEFPAIIEFSKNKQIGVGIDPGWGGEDFAPRIDGFSTGAEGGTIPTGYVNVNVYPLRIKSVVTAVEQVETAREVESVQYYDLQGRMSDKPFSGVNIKVTTRSDGTRETKKLVK